MPATECRPVLFSDAPRRELPRLVPAGAAHLVGACGSGMKALAEILSGLGWRVSGSDQQPAAGVVEQWRRRGLNLRTGHDESHLSEDAEILVYSPAIRPDNPERRAAEARGLTQLSYPQMVGRLMERKTGVCISGTHGKSTTTAMTAWILTTAGLAPSAVVGAELRGTRLNGWAGDGPLFVAESCEYQRSFLNHAPTHLAILGIEPDHFDYFRSFDDTVAAFAEFARKVPAHGSLLINAACVEARRACREAAAPVETFGVQVVGGSAVGVPASAGLRAWNSDSNAASDVATASIARRPAKAGTPAAGNSTGELPDWWAADLRPSKTGVRFRIFRQGEFFTEVDLPLPGVHNVQNALAASALAAHAGASPRAIREGLHEFPGIRRRLETLGSWRGVTLIDDYAHHPTAVRLALRAVRERFDRRRIWAIFQPHQWSRTQALMSEFAASFADADVAVIAPIYGARESNPETLTEGARQLAAEIAAQHPSARFLPALDRITATIEDEVEPGDVLVTLGAGDIDQVHHALTRRLQRHYPPR